MTAAPDWTANGPVVATTAGAVRGRWGPEPGVATFRAVPYAAPPFGPRRFEAPEAPEPWSGVRDALEPGPTALQKPGRVGLIPEPVANGPDCLHVDVYTPGPAGDLRPVVVYLHGGGFLGGGNRSPWYDGSRFARDGVVLVVPNSRLGVDGFLAIDGAPSNRGVLDLVAALRWVAEEVEAFGGDPRDVTVVGQSAGGVAAATLLVVPAADGLFGRVVLMSGAGQGLTSPAGAEVQRAVAAERLGRPVDREALATVPDDEVIALGELLGDREARPELPFLLGPVVDGEVVVERPLDAARAGRTDDVEVVVGATSQELVVPHIVHALTLDDARLDRHLAAAGLTGDQAARYRDLHPGEPAWKVAGHLATDAYFRAPAARLVRARADAGAPAFAYEFRWEPPGPMGLGAVHCIDVPFAFDLLGAEGVEAVAGAHPPQALAGAVHGALVRFARSGDAGWARHDGHTATVMAFDDPCTAVDGAWTDLLELFPEEPAS